MLMEDICKFTNVEVWGDELDGHFTETAHGIFPYLPCMYQPADHHPSYGSKKKKLCDAI